MSTPYDISRKRLENDIRELEKIQCRAIKSTISGTPPSKVRIVFNIRSIVGLSSTGTPVYRDKHEVEISIPSGYPFSGTPEAAMARGYSPLYHPNFWSSGSICTQASAWTANETLALFVIRLAKMFQFDPMITNPSSPANSSAAAWYQENLGNGFFPTDRQPLPMLDGDDDDFKLLEDPDFKII